MLSTLAAPSFWDAPFRTASASQVRPSHRQAYTGAVDPCRLVPSPTFIVAILRWSTATPPPRTPRTPYPPFSPFSWMCAGVRERGGYAVQSPPEGYLPKGLRPFRAFLYCQVCCAHAVQCGRPHPLLHVPCQPLSCAPRALPLVPCAERNPADGRRCLRVVYERRGQDRRLQNVASGPRLVHLRRAWRPRGRVRAQ